MGENVGTDLKADIKKMIIETLNIEDVTSEDIGDELILFGGDNTLGLDSIDAIELVMALQRDFKVRLDDQNLAREVLVNVNSIANFIQSKSE
ncbi:MAG: phosphopantetheine-binding protein [Bacteroidales bacterium]|jgi:acyl carrier protein|nr:phosphopantetheine-binding protein [Bacteroidales bacterium]